MIKHHAPNHFVATRKLLHGEAVYSEVLLGQFHADLMEYAESYEFKSANIFQADPAMLELTNKAIKTFNYESGAISQFYQKLSPAWAENATWQNLRNLVQLPEAPRVPVIYFYRNVTASSKLNFKEVLLDDFKKQFGERPISDFLTPAGLAKIWALPDPPLQ